MDPSYPLLKIFKKMMTGVLKGRYGTQRNASGAAYVICPARTAPFIKIKTDTMKRIYSTARAAVFVSSNVLQDAYHWK